MKLLTFLQDGREQPGVLDRAGTGVLPLESLGLPFESVLSLIETASHEQMQLLHQAFYGQASCPNPVFPPGHDLHRL